MTLSPLRSHALGEDRRFWQKTVAVSQRPKCVEGPILVVDLFNQIRDALLLRGVRRGDALRPHALGALRAQLGAVAAAYGTNYAMVMMREGWAGSTDVGAALRFSVAAAVLAAVRNVSRNA